MQMYYDQYNNKILYPEKLHSENGFLLSSGKRSGKEQNTYLLDYVVELASDMDNNNFEKSDKRSTDDNHLQEITHNCK